MAAFYKTYLIFFLLRKPNSVRQVDRTGKSAVHYCAENQNITCLEQVLEVAPSLMEEGDNEGYTPLHLAVIAGNTNIIRSKDRDLK